MSFRFQRATTGFGTAIARRFVKDRNKFVAVGQSEAAKVHEGTLRLTSDDIAEAATWSMKVTDIQVNVNRIELMPIFQSETRKDADANDGRSVPSLFEGHYYAEQQMLKSFPEMIRSVQNEARLIPQEY